VSVTIVALDSPRLLGPVLGLRVRVCERSSATCGGSPELERITGPGGAATFEEIRVRDGLDAFDGYFEVVDPNGGRVPTYVFLSPPARGSRVIVMPSLTNAARAEIERDLGVSTSPLSALIGVRPIDCSGGEGAGVKLSLDGDNPEVTPFYLDRRLPTVASPRSATDSVLAFGGFVGVPPGNKTVRGRWAANDAELFSVSVRANEGSFTYVSFAARP
jgi:hypothetical protein